MVEKSLKTKVRDLFVKSFPYSLALSAVIFSSALTFTYNKTSEIADLNKDGATSQREWGEVFSRIGEEYHPDSYFPWVDVIRNRRAIEGVYNYRKALH